MSYIIKSPGASPTLYTNTQPHTHSKHSFGDNRSKPRSNPYFKIKSELNTIAFITVEAINDDATRKIDIRKTIHQLLAQTFLAVVSRIS